MPSRPHIYPERIDESEEEYERQLETESKRDNLLRKTAVLGDDMRAFLTSPLGRELWKRAERDKRAAAMELLGLAVDSPDFKEQFLAIQARGMTGAKFHEYCASIEEIGEVALRQARGEGES